MKIFHDIAEFIPTSKTIVTLGTFDGVHNGHQKIIDRLIQNAQDNDSESLILTFFPHPRMILQEGSDIQLLNTIEEKCLLLEQRGIDNLVIHPFDKAFSRLTAEEFVRDILVEKFNICKIIIGHDHRFGRNRTANIDDLMQFGEIYGFEVEQISSLEIDEIAVSSTKIRNALLTGDITLANRYLGYDYFFSGVVEKGRQLGRQLGYPTANIHVKDDYKLIPALGIYVVSSLLRDKIVYGMMSIGTNPTVGGTARTIEVYYFDLNEDLYGMNLTVSVLTKIRDEEKFNSIDALQDQLHKDKDFSISFIQKIR
ncbi:MAG: riboflavin biosynthesis protein RibF [Flavobacterium sp. BFFFF1]|uniref:bifunctional riboflavin kinase/FAD synthetase n=1 Tax=Flavobacterium sp. BFFFF1 TaxID=2015557 RepID=UPI000BD5FA06|nr:bifunctional riboflavin kinase/FAD synthetase [Flavobacterium sp. BFFFF1]OYU80259.1 MAG: riboflavin biosynthesis protein RibF [Flavobacterium sp. BFFFF1]